MYEDYLIVANHDEKFVADLKERIKKNGGYCPSKFERTPDTKCHCKEYKEKGNCICGLFIKVPCCTIGE